MILLVKVCVKVVVSSRSCRQETDNRDRKNILTIEKIGLEKAILKINDALI